MMRFDIEWLPPPSVRDRVHAETWATFRLELDHAVPTTLIDMRARGAQRTRIDGSVFPLAEWIVENWWTLHFEGPIESPRRIRPGREAALLPAMRPWVARHNLLGAREGGALPDLYFFRDAEFISAMWRPDPSGLDATVRFVESGEARIPLDEFRSHLQGLVDSVLARLRESRAPAVTKLSEDWQAIRASSDEETALCAALGRLGVDPHDPASVSDELEEQVVDDLARFRPQVLEELLAASTPERLAQDSEWIGTVDAKTMTDLPLAPLQRLVAAAVNGGVSAHERGYQRARIARRSALGLGDDEPIESLADLLTQRLDWADRPLKRIDVPPSSGIEAALVETKSGAAIYGARESRPLTSDRFRLARALRAWGFGPGSSRTKLLTRAFTWEQRASRAFAAELLAPSVGLRKLLPERVSFDDLHRVADHYQVSPLCVEHQIENHGIGVLAA